jgi:hypothetical protein
LALPEFHAASLSQGEDYLPELLGRLFLPFKPSNVFRTYYPSPFITLAAEDDNKKFSTLPVISVNSGMGRA